MTSRSRHPLTVLAAVLAALPEVTVGLSLLRAARSRLTTGGSDRGDTVQWVILTAIGAAIAITVGTIIYSKLTAKANQIDVGTPGTGS